MGDSLGSTAPNGAWRLTGTDPALPDKVKWAGHPKLGGLIRTFFVSLLGAATLTAGLLLIRQQREVEAELEVKKQIPAGERTARVVDLDRLRELGL